MLVGLGLLGARCGRAGLQVAAEDQWQRKWPTAVHGEEGFYEVLLELQNIVPLAYLVRDRIDHDSYVGVPDFLDLRTLPTGKFDLRFRYTIRPADFKAKVQIQQRLSRITKIW